jgi:hypothetical protein
VFAFKDACGKMRESRRVGEVENLNPEVCIRRCKRDTLHEADHSVSQFTALLDKEQF